jgi:hypothetical protein
MSRPLRRTDTSFIHFHKRVPADILRLTKGKTFTFVILCDDPNEPEIVAMVTLNAEMKFSLHTRDPAIAKLRAGLATAQFERYCAGLRNSPRPLTHKEIIALCQGKRAPHQHQRPCEAEKPISGASGDAAQ